MDCVAKRANLLFWQRARVLGGEESGVSHIAELSDWFNSTRATPWHYVRAAQYHTKILCALNNHIPTSLSPPYTLATKMATSSVARQYTYVNQNMPKDYWDYDTLQVQWGVQDNYE